MNEQNRDRADETDQRQDEALNKQWHNRWTDRGKESWDIDRLIELVRDFRIQTIPLSEIDEYEQVYWFDEDFRPTCRSVVEHAKRIEAVDLGYPIILSATGLVMDGMHRVAKAHLMGKSTIKAVRFENDPEPDRITPQSKPAHAQG